MDLDLRINGNADGARDAFNEAGGAAGQLGEDVGKSVVKWQALVQAAELAVKAVVKFGIDSVKAYAESERIQKQLVRASGEYAGALDNQAKALSRLYAVDDDVIKQSQILLTQWGGVGAATADVEKAALNLAAAFGGDLNSATSDLIRNVESGGVGLGKLGIHFKATGDKGHDLAAAVAAINAKLGGAAAADANSLTGQLHAAQIAFEDIQKSIGGSVAEFIKQSGVVEALTKKMRELNGLFTPSADQKEQDPAYVAQQVQFWEDIASGNVEGWKDAEKGIKFTFEEASAELAKWRAKLRPSDLNAAYDGGSGKPAVTGLTNKGTKDATGDFLSEPDAGWKKSFQEDTSAQVDLMAERSAKIQAEEEKAAAEYAAIMKEQSAEQLKARKEGLDAEEKMVIDSYRAQRAAEEQKSKEESDSLHKQAQAWANAGAAIGNAFVSELSAQLEKLAEGGEFDTAMFVGDILAAAFSAAATAVGAAYGQGAIGALVGNIGAIGIRAGARGISADSKKRRATSQANRASYSYHTGGWIGDEAQLPRHHSGAWLGENEVPFIGLKDERVLSHQEIHHMGGAGAVDAMAKGRGTGGVTNIFNVSALDAKSAADSFEGQVGQGLKRARESGRGDVPMLLGSPR